jgi:membrane-associated phospholipid phosphatase
MNPLHFFLIFVFLLQIHTSVCQSNDSVADSTKMEEIKGSLNKKWYKSRVFKAAIAPTVLIGLGVSTIQNHGIYSSYDARNDMQRLFPSFRTRIDDYLIFAPYAELAVLNLLKVNCQNDFTNTALLIIKTEIIVNALTFSIKYITNIQRPDSSDFRSFPSGHTAQAFAAAAIVHKEFRYKSQWYGVGAYTIATAVGFFRMANNKHWLSDVLAGAGFGILSAQIAYLTHQYKWGRKTQCFLPTYNNGSLGIIYQAAF